MVLEELIYSEMTEKDIPEVLGISDKQFGLGYNTEKELRNYLWDANIFLPVIRHQNKLIAYSIIHMMGRDGLNQFQLDPCFDKIQIDDMELNIQVLKSIAIRPAYMKKGIGSLFMKRNDALLKTKTDVAISINWRRKSKIPLSRISEELGMKKCCEIKNYWKSQSLEQGFICPECGNPPCECSAVIYYKWIA